MPSSRRCVFGCVTKGLTVHSFPNPAKFPEQFRTWVELCGQELRNLSVDEIYPRLKVCDKHFIESHRNRNNRLNALAIPSLHLTQSLPEPNVCVATEPSERILVEDNINIPLDKNIDQDAIFGVRNDHDYCDRSCSGKKTFNLSYYQETERKTRNLRREILRLRKKYLTINVTVYSWCRSINRILCGKIAYDGDDETKIYAQMYYNKHKHNKNKK
ncbi:hypothetical protein ABMA28_007113 [Loxostege sticticalis]|uniref:THAP-type domain-containing protein n=1 Tax=Loxostege sticticalis TaxID=481309 RepID=A0ABD0TPK9_LOXSC